MIDNLDSKIIQDSEFLGDLLVDSNMLTGEPGRCTTEVGKRALDIYYQFEDKPEKIKFGDVQDLVISEGTQIGNARDYLAHVSNTGGVFRSMVKILEKTRPNLDLPHPDVAYVIGLIHDLNATYSDYAKGGQQSKEFDQFLLAKRLGWVVVEEQVSMHSDYLGGIKLMFEGADFPMKEAYAEMTEVLRGDGPLSYNAIESQFAGYLAGMERPHLMLLTVSDYIENGKPHFNAASFEQDFDARAGDIIWRYHGKAKSEGKLPSLLGQALVNGGIERIGHYKDIVLSLLNNDKEKIEELKETTKLFR